MADNHSSKPSTTPIDESSAQYPKLSPEDKERFLASFAKEHKAREEMGAVHYARNDPKPGQ